ncbi:MAG: hypothetical protein WD874_01655 [Parcubacteria group bacterium]
MRTETSNPKGKDIRKDKFYGNIEMQRLNPYPNARPYPPPLLVGEVPLEVLGDKHPR